MNKDKILALKTAFDNLAHKTEDGIEYWLARELKDLLGYVEWRKFENTILKAENSCKASGYAISDHFVGVDKMINLAKGAIRKVSDYMLTRYACYLIAQNGDSGK